MQLACVVAAVSVAVRRQYEENPYPRLVSWHRKPAEPLDRVLRSILPQATMVYMLIAGGTVAVRAQSRSRARVSAT